MPANICVLTTMVSSVTELFAHFSVLGQFLSCVWLRFYSMCCYWN